MRWCKLLQLYQAHPQTDPREGAQPMQGKLPMHLSPRCGARSKRTGEPCQSAAMKNGRCRMHGGKSSGAPKGNQNALKHGNYTAAAQAASREKKREIRRSWRLSGGSFANCRRNGLTVLSLRGSVGADTKQPYDGALLTK